jgi:CRISPR-associated protein Csx10
LTRVGINRRRATAEDEILYSLEILNESQDKEKKQYFIAVQFWLQTLK